jgi:antitoxin component YwqK of YwqJK toxin-antitoxin module
MGDSEQYWVSKDGENMGPFALDQIQEKIEEGSLSASDHLCEVGEDEWTPISQALDLPENEEDEVESQQIVLKGASGGSLNALLTVFFAVLVIVFVGFYFFAKLPSPKDNDAEEKISTIDLVEIEKNATELSNLELRDGLTFMRSEDSPFSGWSIQKFSGTGKVSNVVQFEAGKAMNAHSWKPNGEKCPDTTLSGGSGVLFVYFDNGSKASESHYTQGLLNGMKLVWHENGEKRQEGFYQEGKLHGRSISRHRNGQMTEEINYADGLEHGSYAFWTEGGQKIEEGSYLAGKRDGKLTIWTPDGDKEKEEAYLDGTLVLTPDPVPIASPDGNTSPEFQKKVKELQEVVNSVSNRFSEKNALGSASFATLASALSLYGASKGEPDEQDNLVALKGAFSAFRVNWGMNQGVEGKDFALSVIPESVAYGEVTLSREDYLASNPVPLGANSLEDLEFVLEQTQKLFDCMGVSLEKDASYLEHEFAKRIWQDLLAKAKGAKKANLFVKNGLLSFKDTETVQIKSIAPTGRSVFTNKKKDVDRAFSGSILDEKMEKYLSVLKSANGSFVDAPSEANPRLMIRKYESLVLPAGGNEDIYPNVTIMLAGIAPLNNNTVIRAVKVDLGDPLPPPTAD